MCRSNYSCRVVSAKEFLLNLNPDFVHHLSARSALSSSCRTFASSSFIRFSAARSGADRSSVHSGACAYRFRLCTFVIRVLVLGATKQPDSKLTLPWGFSSLDNSLHTGKRLRLKTILIGFLAFLLVCHPIITTPTPTPFSPLFLRRDAKASKAFSHFTSYRLVCRPSPYRRLLQKNPSMPSQASHGLVQGSDWRASTRHRRCRQPQEEMKGSNGVTDDSSGDGVRPERRAGSGPRIFRARGGHRP
jgi:hypothetical protein